MHTNLLEFLAGAFCLLLLCNNNNAIVLFNNPTFHFKFKHTNIKYKFLCEHVNNGQAYLPCVLFHDNIPNNFMQALIFQVYTCHCTTMGLQDSNGEVGEGNILFYFHFFSFHQHTVYVLSRSIITGHVTDICIPTLTKFIMLVIFIFLLFLTCSY